MAEGGTTRWSRTGAASSSTLTYEARRNLTDGWYGIHEAQER